MKKKFSEDAPTNSTGPAVSGTNGDPSEVFKKKKKKSKIVKRLKSTYEVEIDDSTVSVIKNPKLKNYFNNYTLHFESKNGDLTYENQ